MSNATREAAEVPLTAFKLALEHGGRQPFTTYHRFSGRFTFDEVSALVSHLWGGSKRLVVAYTDDEGDEIVVTSGIEWSECLRLHHETSVGEGRHPLLLRVKRVTWVGRSGRPASRAKRDVVSDGDANEDEEEDAEDTGSEDSETSASIRFNSASARLSKIQALRGEASAATREQHADPVVAAETEGGSTATPKTGTIPVPRLHLSVVSRMQNGSVQTSASVENACQSDDLLCLLSAVTSMDAATALFKGEYTGALSMMVSRTVNPVTGEVGVDVDMRKLEELCLAYSATRDDDAQAMFLELALRVFPKSPFLWYDMTCALARRGRLDDALSALRTSLQCGLKARQMILSEECLAPLRSTNSFHEMTALHFPESGDATHITATPKPEGNSDSAIPTAASQQAEDVVAGLESSPVPRDLSPATEPAAAAPSAASAWDVILPTPRTGLVHTVFPHMALGEVRGLLSRAEGDVSRAINIQLDS